MNPPTPEFDGQDLLLVTTGITGLDDILIGGLPGGQVYLIEGDPGTGKTTLAMQFMQEGMRLGESCLYVTFSESRRQLLASSRSHGWSMERLPIVEMIPGQNALEEGQRYTVFHLSEVELVSTTRRLIEEVERVNPTRLVLDSLSEFRLLSGDAVRYRRQLLALRQFLEARNATVLLLDDRAANGNNDLQLQTLTHGVIRLQKLQRSYGVTRRHLEIVKMRGAAYREGFHDYTIHHGGMEVYPRLIAAEHAVASHSRQVVRSNVAELDLLLGGGIDPGSSTLILGPTGVGKSSIALVYAFAATQRGERTLYYTFDETAQTTKMRAESFGMDLDAEIQKGTLHLQQVDPAELSPGELVCGMRHEIERNSARMIVIDSLNGMMAVLKDCLHLIREHWQGLSRRKEGLHSIR